MKVLAKVSWVWMAAGVMVLSGCAVMGPIGYSFYSAARSGSLSEAEKMLQQGKDINATGEFGISPIQQAVMNNDIPMAKFLLEHGANPNVRAMGGTPLIIAIRNGYTEAALLLIEHGADVNDPNPWIKQRPLITCSAYGNAQVAKALIDAGADVNYRDDKGKTAVDYATDYKKLEILAVLKKAGASVSYTGDKAKDIVTAVISEDRGKVRELLEQGSDPNTKTTSGKSLLSYAVEYKWTDIVGLLISKGADVKARDKDGWTLLMTAALANDMEMVKAFEVAGVTGYTGVVREDFLLAILLGDRPKAEECLAKGADINGKYRQDSTVLFYAAYKNDRSMAEWLLQKGANINIVNRVHMTPLLIALGKGGAELGRFMLEHGADPQARDDQGMPALNYAIKTGDVPLVKYMLERGVQPGPDSVLMAMGKIQGLEKIYFPQIADLLKPEVLHRQMLRAQAAVESAQSQEDYQKAIAEYQLAKVLSPETAEIYYNLGLVQEKAGSYQEAIESLQKYLQLVPSAADAQTVKDMIYKLEYKRDQKSK